MVRGVNRSVIEVNDTGNKYFERVIFFVNPDYSHEGDAKLQKAATDYIKSADGQKFIKPKSKKKSSPKKFAAAAIIGTLCAAAITAVILIL